MARLRFTLKTKIMSITLDTNKHWFSDKGTTLKLFEQILLFIDVETLKVITK